MQRKEDSVMSGVTLEDLLSAAASGQPYNQYRLGREAERYAGKVSRVRAGYLPDDLHYEIAQEAFLKFWERREQPRKGKTFKQVYRACVIAAIRTIRANYTSPGHKTRSSGNAKPPKTAVEAIAPATRQASGLVASGTSDEQGVPDVVQVSSAAAEEAMAAIEHRIDVQRILDHAPDQIRSALVLIHFEAKPVGEVADLAGITRFSLKRRMDAYAQQWRAAA